MSIRDDHPGGEANERKADKIKKSLMFNTNKLINKTLIESNEKQTAERKAIGKQYLFAAS